MLKIIIQLSTRIASLIRLYPSLHYVIYISFIHIVKIFFHTFSVLGQCRALYEYKAAQSDELDLLPGDVITLTARLDGGWWQGELHNKTGVFPASYVEEIQ